MLFYAKNVTERLVDKGPWRTIIVEFQTTRFVPGWTDEPLFSVGWNFEALTASGEDFANFVLMWPNFYFMSVVPYPPGPPWPATRDDAERHLGKGVWESAPAGPL
jgi:hypothetical protein